MPKISIYVPDEMKVRMDAAESRANWSAHAQRAFSIELDHLEAITEIKSMTDVIERLRASKQKLAQASIADGRIAGREWAMQSAEYDELKRVAALNADLLLEIYQEPDIAARTIVIQAIVDDRDEARSILSRDSDTGDLFSIDQDMVDATLTQEWLAGFVEGVQAVLVEIADKI